MLITHAANHWALEHLPVGTPLEDLGDAPFTWQPGWHWSVADGNWTLPDD